MVIIMVKDVELFVALFILFIAIIVLFNARWFIKNKVKKEVENKVVKWIKIISYIICIICLVCIYYIY